MKKKKIFFGVALVAFATSCSSPKEEKDFSKSKNETNSINFQSEEGEELFKANCITCHTLQYIDMQPNFTRKTWEKITDKMIKNFGAPIPDSTAKKIVDYLMAIKGKK